MRIGVSLLLAVLLVAPATASLIEEISGGVVTYQFDGESHHDAPGMCDAASPEWLLEVGNTTDGLLVPVDDEADHFILNTTDMHLGDRITVRVDDTSTPAGDIEVRFDILVPTCMGSVLEPANQPPVPESPGQGQQSVHAQNQAAAAPCADRWFFVITGVNHSTAPATVRAIWTDGHFEDIAMRPSPPHPVGQYQTTTNLGISLHSITALLPADWNGNFRIGEAPCNTVNGGYVFGEPAVRVGNGIEFSVMKGGTYIVGVYYEQVAPVDPTEPMTMSCHFCPLIGDIAEPTVERVSYKLLSESDEAS